MAPTNTLRKQPVQSEEDKEEFTLTLRVISALKQSQYNQRWQRFVVGVDATGQEFVFNAEGNLSRHLGELAKGDTVTVTAFRGRTVDREWNGKTTQQVRLNRVYLAE